MPPYNILEPATVNLAKAFMHPEQTFDQLKKKIVSFLQPSFPWLTKEHVRFWKANYNYSRKDKLIEFLQKNHIGGPETKFITEETDPDIVENAGVDFPGSQFDMYTAKTFKENESTQNSISHYDLIVVELADQSG